MGPSGCVRIGSGFLMESGGDPWHPMQNRDFKDRRDGVSGRRASGAATGPRVWSPPSCICRSRRFQASHLLANAPRRRKLNARGI